MVVSLMLMPKLKRVTGLSAFYKDKARVYERFSEAEDAPKKILRAILPKLKNKVVLDIGCGTGKYAKLLFPYVKSYCGLDVSRNQLSIARRKIGNLKNVTLVHCDATKAKLPDRFFDAVVAFWSISTIDSSPKKGRVVAMAMRTLKPGGMMYLFENAASGAFDRATGPFRREEALKYNRWLKERGFKIAHKINTHFHFSSVKVAKKIFKEIWGDEAASKILGEKVGHNVIMFQKRKRV